MKKVCLIFLFFLFFYRSYAQVDKILIKSAYHFLNLYFKTIENTNYKLDVNLIPYKTDQLDFTAILNNKDFNEEIGPKINFDTVLNNGDIQNIKQQLLYWRNTKQLDVRLLNINPIKILKVSDSQSRKNLFPDYVIWKIAMPVFSVKKDIAILYIEKYCGMDCGDGQIIFLQKQHNGLWKVLYTKAIWLS